MPYKVFNFIFASGATGTNKQYVGAHERAFVVPSAMTNYNAGSGNATIELRGGLSASDTHVAVQSCTVATMTAKSVLPMPYPGLHYMSIGFATAVTGAANNSIDVVVYSKSEDV